MYYFTLFLNNFKWTGIWHPTEWSFNHQPSCSKNFSRDCGAGSTHIIPFTINNNLHNDIGSMHFGPPFLAWRIRYIIVGAENRPLAPHRVSRTIIRLVTKYNTK